jgi:hypothetical protein
VVSNDSMLEMPLLASHSAAKRASTDSARAVMQPKPVMTTRRLLIVNLSSTVGLWTG